LCYCSGASGSHLMEIYYDEKGEGNAGGRDRDSWTPMAVPATLNSFASTDAERLAATALFR